FAALEAALAESEDGADDISDALRVQLKELGLALSITDLDDDIINDFAQQAEAVRKNFYVYMATECGTINRVEVEHCSNVRSNGLRASELAGDDTLIGVAMTDSEQQIMLF